MNFALITCAADKGAGIVILNFTDYMTACYEHLLSSVPIQSDAVEPKTYYKAVNELAVEKATIKIEDV